MANFNVAYIVSLQDKFSAQARKINRSLDTIDKKLKQTSRRADKLSKSLSEAGKNLSLKLTLPIAAVAGFSIKAASDAEEIRSKFATVFKAVGADAEKVSQDLAENFGLSSVKSKELLADTGDLLTGFGFTGKAALSLAEKTNKLAVDLASFTNFSGGAEGASKALTKALLGERESVKSLGIAILDKDVKEKVALLRSKGMKFASDRQAKAEATLLIAIEQSQNAIGDYERTKESFANQSRKLTNKIFDLKVAIGDVLLPAVTRLTKKTINLVKKLTNFSKENPKLAKTLMTVALALAAAGPLLLTMGIAAKGAALAMSGLSIITGAMSVVLAKNTVAQVSNNAASMMGMKIIPKRTFFTKIIIGFNKVMNAQLKWNTILTLANGAASLIAAKSKTIFSAATAFSTKSLLLNSGVMLKSIFSLKAWGRGLKFVAVAVRAAGVIVASFAAGPIAAVVVGVTAAVWAVNKLIEAWKTFWELKEMGGLTDIFKDPKEESDKAAGLAKGKFDTPEMQAKAMSIIGESRQKIQAEIVIKDKGGNVESAKSSSSAGDVSTSLDQGVGLIGGF